MGIDRRIEPESLYVLDCYQELLPGGGQEGGGFDDNDYDQEQPEEQSMSDGGRRRSPAEETMGDYGLGNRLGLISLMGDALHVDIVDPQACFENLKAHCQT